MGKFCQISTELWPLIYVKILFQVSNLSIYRPVFFKLCIGVHIRKESFAIEDLGKFRQISTELWPLIYVKILFPGSILSI